MKDATHLPLYIGLGTEDYTFNGIEHMMQVLPSIDSSVLVVQQQWFYRSASIRYQEYNLTVFVFVLCLFYYRSVNSLSSQPIVLRQEEQDRGQEPGQQEEEESLDEEDDDGGLSPSQDVVEFWIND